MFRILHKINSGLIKRSLQRCPIHTTSSSRRSDDCEPEARYMYSAEVENAVNVQVTQELYASHQYLAMASHFGRTEIGLIGSSGTTLCRTSTFSHPQYFYRNVLGNVRRGTTTRFRSYEIPKHSRRQCHAYTNTATQSTDLAIASSGRLSGPAVGNGKCSCLDGIVRCGRSPK